MERSKSFSFLLLETMQIRTTRLTSCNTITICQRGQTNNFAYMQCESELLVVQRKKKYITRRRPKEKKKKEKNKNKKKRKSYKFTMSSQPKHYILVGSIIYKKPK